MILIEAQNCAGCRWWKRFDEASDTGVCASVQLNDYAQADLVREDHTPGRTLLVTNADFGCRDFEPNDSHAD